MPLLAAVLLFHTCFFARSISQGWPNLFNRRVICRKPKTPASCKTTCREKFYQEVRRQIPSTLAYGDLVEICIACWYSNQNYRWNSYHSNIYKYIVATRPVSTGGVPPQGFLFPPIFCALKSLFQPYSKNKNLDPLKCIFPQISKNLATGLVATGPYYLNKM